MPSHSIEAGQRLNMRTNDKSGIVLVQAEAIVPTGYWICQDEASGQRRVVAATALSPIEPPVVTPSVTGPIEPTVGPAEAVASDCGEPPAPLVNGGGIRQREEEAVASDCGEPPAPLVDAGGIRRMEEAVASECGGPPDGRVAA